MLKGLAEAAGIALSLVTVVETAQADIEFPDQCFPDCNSYYENLECQAWLGPNWYYCGWANGWTYCCNG
jgi:hypothetical protein